MARKKPRGRPRAAVGRPAAEGDDLERRVIAAAMRLAAERGWRHVALADIARAADISLATLHAHFPTRAAILNAFIAGIDETTLSAAPAAEDSVRDRLFDLLMRRFDALRPHKAGVRAVLAAAICDPPAAACLGLRLFRSMTWIAEAAGVASAGPLGLLRVKALAAAYAMVLRTWLDDESEDQSLTMAALDRALKRLEMLENSVPGRRAAEAGAAS